MRWAGSIGTWTATHGSKSGKWCEPKLVGSGLPPLDALNDITIARGHQLRVIDVSTVVDGVHFATFRGDGVVVATATGSTGYALSLGGPVMDPMSRDYLVKPIATHMSQFGGVVIKSTSTLRIHRDCQDAGNVERRWLHGRRSRQRPNRPRVPLAASRPISQEPSVPRHSGARYPCAWAIRKGALPGTEQDPGESNTI